MSAIQCWPVAPSSAIVCTHMRNTCLQELSLLAAWHWQAATDALQLASFPWSVSFAKPSLATQSFPTVCQGPRSCAAAVQLRPNRAASMLLPAVAGCVHELVEVERDATLPLRIKHLKHARGGLQERGHAHELRQAQAVAQIWIEALKQRREGMLIEAVPCTHAGTCSVPACGHAEDAAICALCGQQACLRACAPCVQQAGTLCGAQRQLAAA